MKPQALYLAIRCVLVFLLSLPPIASPGPLGSASAGSLGCHLVKTVVTRADGLADIPLGRRTPGGDFVGDDDLCIGLLSTTRYRVRATGSGTPENPFGFALRNGSHYLDYLAYFNDHTGIQGRTLLRPGVDLPGQSGRLGEVQLIRNARLGCVTENANLSIVIPAPTLRQAGAGIYSGTLTLTVAPE